MRRVIWFLFGGGPDTDYFYCERGGDNLRANDADVTGRR